MVISDQLLKINVCIIHNYLFSLISTILIVPVLKFVVHNVSDPFCVLNWDSLLCYTL